MSGCVELLACMHAMKYSGERKALWSWKSLFLQCFSPPLFLREHEIMLPGVFSSVFLADIPAAASLN